METIVTTAQVVGVVLAGLLARFGLLLLLALLIAIPVLLVFRAVRAAGDLRQRLLGIAPMDGITWRSGSYYAPGHTWVRPDGRNAVRIGIDDLAQRLLTDTSAVELPAPGREVREGMAATVVTCGRKRAAIASPVDGTVVAVNEALVENPSLIHRDPYTRGWLIEVAPRDTRYMGLLQGERARQWLRDERGRLAEFLEAQMGIAAADGGELIVPAPSVLTDEQWTALGRTFLKTG
jgi:glycine cleavage system H protein